MTATMSTKMVSIQFRVPKPIRARLKAQASLTDLDMGPLGAILLDHGLALLESGRMPKELSAAITKAQEEASLDD